MDNTSQAFLLAHITVYTLQWHLHIAVCTRVCVCMYEGEARKGSGYESLTFGIENWIALDVCKSNEVSWLPKIASFTSGTIVFNSALGERVFSKNLRSLEELVDCIKLVYKIRFKFGTKPLVQNLFSFLFETCRWEIFLYLNCQAALETVNFVLLSTANLSLTYLKELTLPRFLKRMSRPKRTPRPVKGFLGLSNFRLITSLKRQVLILL